MTIICERYNISHVEYTGTQSKNIHKNKQSENLCTGKYVFEQKNTPHNFTCYQQMEKYMGYFMEDNFSTSLNICK